MSKEVVAKKALRHLHSDLLNDLNPIATDHFYTNDLLSENEFQTIKAAETAYTKNGRLLDALRRRGDEVKVLDNFIQYLEGEDGETKELNKKLLQKIEKEYKPHYSYSLETELTDDLYPKPQQPPTPQVQPQPFVKVPFVNLPPLNIEQEMDSPLPLRPIQILPVSEEGTDGGGIKRDGAYLMNTIPKGLCIIINNENFQNMKARAGSSYDANSLDKMFGKHLGFQVENFKDMSSKAIMQLMDQVRLLDHSKLKCFVLCILTHGVDGEVYGSDGQLVSIQNITRTFTGTKCPTLAGKPKVFLLQACRGGQFDHGVTYEQTDDGKEDMIVDVKSVLAEEETDGGGYTRALPDESDFLLAYATTPGFVSWRNSAFGTWFIKAFVDTMYAQAGDDHLMDILTEVNRKVAEEYHSREFKKQMPAPVTMLRYKLFLPPIKQ